jgi:hypothetical protein
VISATKNSNKLHKTRFWKEKSVENVVTLEGLPFNSSMLKIQINFKKPSFGRKNQLRTWSHLKAYCSIQA